MTDDWSGCPDHCDQMAYAQLLGPLRPNVTVCEHGVRRQLDNDNGGTKPAGEQPT